MFDYFIRFKEEHPSSLRLVLTGKDDISIPNHGEIDFRGFVSAEEKFSLMAGAKVYLMPSGKESFSIVALEAMAQRTPLLASGESAVLTDHIRKSGGGRVYHDYETFAANLVEMLSNEAERERIGEQGRHYVVSSYAPERIRAALIDAIESCPAVSELPEAISCSFPDDAATPAKIETKVADDLTLESLSKSPPLPLPPGWTEESLKRLISSVRVEDGPAEELRTYAEGDFKRFVYTLGMVPEKSGQRILELGANPYFTTILLKKFRDGELYLANFFDGAQPQGKQSVTIGETGEVIENAYQQFNIETDRFPYGDDFFDVILFCEIIEHLLSDPVHALTEIKRVLKPGGTLVLTTPNAARLDNVRKVIAGENVYDPYSGYGPYGRHNREYVPEDLFGLLSSNGFNIRSLFTADVHPGHPSSSVSLSSIAPLVKDRSTDLGQYIFCQCSVNRQSKQLPPVMPPWLYRSIHPKRASDKEQPEER